MNLVVSNSERSSGIPYWPARPAQLGQEPAPSGDDHAGELELIDDLQRLAAPVG